MPNYLANRAFISIEEMTSFVVDNTDEDLLGPFIVAINQNDYKLVVWRKNSTKTIDNINVFSAVLGRWIALASGGITESLSWNSGDFSLWNSDNFALWNSNNF